MIQAGRLALLLMIPFLFRVGYEVWPGLVGEKPLLALFWIFTVFWSGIVYTFTKLYELGKMPGLTGKERARLQVALSVQRKRIMELALVCGACAFLLLMLVVSSESMPGLTVAWSAGVLVAIAAYYLPLIPIWFEEMHIFTERVTVREERRKEHEQAVKDLGSPPAPPMPNATNAPTALG